MQLISFSPALPRAHIISSRGSLEWPPRASPCSRPFLITPHPSGPSAAQPPEEIQSHNSPPSPAEILLGLLTTFLTSRKAPAILSVSSLRPSMPSTPQQSLCSFCPSFGQAWARCPSFVFHSYLRYHYFLSFLPDRKHHEVNNGLVINVAARGAGEAALEDTCCSGE